MPREPALRNTCRCPRTSLPHLAFHPTDHVQQDIHPTDNPPPSARKSGAGKTRRRAKIRFIIDVISGNIQIMNKKLVDIAKKLVELKYPRINTESNIIVAGNIDDDKDPNDDGDTEKNKDVKDFNYLLKMPISQLTYDRKIILHQIRLYLFQYFLHLLFAPYINY
jgi:hypothetical protein